ncbi:MAG: formylglycine-generating enzyme family protein [Planctomycetota bacterium]|nr:formylglycine-generating enzyme family protein [Planctomycetota bacterium]
MNPTLASARVLASALFALTCAACADTTSVAATEAAPPGMRWIPGGEFTMGSDAPGANPNEAPPHRVRVDGFWLDETAVTNAEFARFVEATKYVTVAERPVDWEEMKKTVAPGTPKPSEDMLAPGSLVFTPTKEPVPLDNLYGWWRWQHGANWRQPEGPGSSIAGRESHPVVQVAWEDAVAYAKWAGKRLPTEAEWEFAARGGLEGKRFAWGDEFRPDGKAMANIYTGTFPVKDTGEDGFAGTAPVKSFPPNGYGLYDMAGNVWNWCSDWFRSDAHVLAAPEGCCQNPVGPRDSWDATDPLAPKRVIKGGSFLCCASYCESYRPSARRGTPPDTGSSHVGFRCAKSGAPQVPGSAR